MPFLLAPARSHADILSQSLAAHLDAHPISFPKPTHGDYCLNVTNHINYMLTFTHL